MSMTARKKCIIMHSISGTVHGDTEVMMVYDYDFIPNEKLLKMN
jgi:hypothetical protein